MLVVWSGSLRFRGILCVRTLDNSVDWARLLAETAVDTLGHVNVVASCSPTTVFTLFCLNCDGLSRADSFAQLAGNASLLASGVSSQGVLASEAGRDWTLLEWIVDCVSASMYQLMLSSALLRFF